MEQPDSPPAAPIISDWVRFNDAVTPLTLTADGRVVWAEGGHRALRVEKEVLGFAAEGSRIRIKAAVDLDGAVCCPGPSRGGGEGLVRRELVFEPLSGESLSLWCKKLQDYMDNLGRPKRLFIFMNPFGGKRMAPKIFSNEVKPLLQDAGIEFDIQETRYQLHAKEIARSIDLSKYDGIVCVSGDGILVEVVNGLLERDDWKAAIKMPLGVIPAGTGNGMAKSLLDSVGLPCKASYATLAIIRGHKRLLDVATISQEDKKFFSVLMLAWGLIADIDIESEKYRWMGSARIDFYAIQRVLHLRRYDGQVSFVPAPGYENHGEPARYSGEQNVQSKGHGEEPVQVLCNAYRGPDIKLEELSWRTIDGPFVSIWLHNVPWGGEDTMAAPKAEFSDGYMDLIAIRDCPKLALLSLMTELSKGGHVKSPHVVYIKVKAFVLEPGPRTDDPTRQGIIDTDGEVLARGKGTYKSDQETLMSYGRLQITVDQGLATLFSPV
ncbi:hypothetical protein CDL15_Pgr000248 [Punica granatum]|uniref:sphingosine kinase n=1 Tax=Punica granatum TaxID=22663 RepID=A0A218Y275_PUNGR|nr:hypothetical protein CDL15_Pgr000248 [Punica granatum]